MSQSDPSLLAALTQDQSADSELGSSSCGDDGEVAVEIASRKAIVVVGMHRSGTSALTRVLGLLGCQMPKTLLPAVPGDNDLGFWESRSIHDLNERILASVASSWDDWQEFHPSWFASDIAKSFAEEARAVLAKEFEAGPLFVLKDPRICRLLPFWLPVLRTAGALPRIVIPVRHPVEVAASLQRRSGIDRGVGLLVWLRHVLDAEHDSRGVPRSFARYDQLLTDWRRVADKIGEDLEIIWPCRSVQVAREVESFLSTRWRRHQETDESFSKDPAAPEWIRTVFSILDRWCRNSVRVEDQADLDAVREAFTRTAPTFAGGIAAAREYRLRLKVTSKQLSVARGELGQALSRVAETEARLAAAGESLRQADEEQRAREACQAEWAQKVATLESANGSLRQQCETLRQLAAALEQREKLAAEHELSKKVAERTRTQSEHIAKLLDLQAVMRAELLQQRESLKRQGRRHQEIIDGIRQEYARTIAEHSRQTEAVKAASNQQQKKWSQEIAALVKEHTKAREVLVQRAKNQSLAFDRAQGQWKQERVQRFNEIAALTRTIEKQRGLADELIQHLQSSVANLLRAAKLPEAGWLGRVRLWRRSNVVRQKQALLQSGMFDANWYVAVNPDVESSGMDPAEHYVLHGAEEGRMPHPAMVVRK